MPKADLFIERMTLRLRCPPDEASAWAGAIAEALAQPEGVDVRSGDHSLETLGVVVRGESRAGRSEFAREVGRHSAAALHRALDEGDPA